MSGLTRRGLLQAGAASATLTALGARPGSAAAQSTAPTSESAAGRALAQEHLCAYAYGVLGPRVSDADDELARRLTAEHKLGRDRLEEEMRAANEEPSAAAPAYPLPVDPRSPATALALAERLEEDTVVVYRDLVATGPAEVRELAVERLLQSASAAATVRTRRAPGAVAAAAVAFPGRLPS